LSSWEILFSSNRIRSLLLPYTSYLHWGIPARLSLKNAVPVFTFGSYFYVLSKLNSKYPFHSKDYHLYEEIFEKLDRKNERIYKGRQELNIRLKGHIDTGTSYMKNSAYTKLTEVDFNPVTDKSWAVIFLHCFFDSPHIYGTGLFADFYDWLEHILTKASFNHDTVFYVKPHPNGLPENIEIIEEFKKRFSKFSNVQFISSKISNLVIAGKKPDAVFTYYGTIAHEFAFLGIPVITSGDNPHSLFRFVYNPSSISELNTFIENVGNYGLPAGYVQDDICKFFYMHYLYYSKKYDASNFIFTKNFLTGALNLPPEIKFKDLIYESI